MFFEEKERQHFKSKKAPISDDVHACFGFASSMRQFLRKQIWMPKTHGKKGGPKIEEAQLLLGSLCGQPRPNPSCAQAPSQTSNAPVIRETRLRVLFR